MLGLSCGGGEGGTEHSASHDDAIALPNERLADDSEPMKVPALNRRFLGLAVTACFLLALLCFQAETGTATRLLNFQMLR